MPQDQTPTLVTGAAESVTVPREPTSDQLYAGQKAWLADPERKSSTLYRAMLDAAPAPSPPQADQGGDPTRGAGDYGAPQADGLSSGDQAAVRPDPTGFDPSRGPHSWTLSDEAQEQLAEIDRHTVSGPSHTIRIPPATPDQVAYLQDLQASLQASTQYDGETLIGPCGPAAGFDGYGSQARQDQPTPVSDAPAPAGDLEVLSADFEVREIARHIERWLTSDRARRDTEGLQSNSATHLVAPPTWPSHGQLQAWIDALNHAAARLRSGAPSPAGEDLAGFRAEIERLRNEADGEFVQAACRVMRANPGFDARDYWDSGISADDFETFLTEDMNEAWRQVEELREQLADTNARLRPAPSAPSAGREEIASAIRANVRLAWTGHDHADIDYRSTLAAADAILALIATSPGDECGETVRHVKSGGVYTILARGAQIQTDTPLTDYAKVDVYQHEETRAVWVRPVEEMHDGRFVPTPPAAATEATGER